jgi:hypothetical protein
VAPQAEQREALDGLLCLRFSPQLSIIDRFDDWLDEKGVPLVRRHDALEAIVLHALDPDAPQVVRGPVRRALLVTCPLERFQEALDSDGLAELAAALSPWGDWFNDLDGEEYTGTIYERTLGLALDPASLPPMLMLERFAAEELTEELAEELDGWLADEHAARLAGGPDVISCAAYAVSEPLVSPSAMHYSPGARLLITGIRPDAETGLPRVDWLERSQRWDLRLTLVTREAFTVRTVA